MQNIDSRDIDRLLENWDRLLAEFPQEKAALLDDLGKELLEEVRQKTRG